MKDVTSTSFGLLIAFFLPGLTVLLGLAFWFSELENILHTFLSAKTDVGLDILLLSGSIVVGLQVTLIRWLLFEKLFCKAHSFDVNAFKFIGTQEWKLTAFRAVAEEHYRYHQFWGGMCIAMPVVFTGWLVQHWTKLDGLDKVAWIGVSIGLEFVTGYGAVSAFRNYIDRGHKILRGK